MQSTSDKPCKHGHYSPRAVKSQECIECRRARDKVRYKKNILSQQVRSRKANWKRYQYPTPTRPTPEHCELCGGLPTKRALHLDHDHQTGQFRGWLCHYCNTSLGRFGDNKHFLQRALDYLEGQLWDGTKGSYRTQIRSEQTKS